jgi:hypothetical protein
VDKDNDGRIDYEEFCSMMRQGNEEVSRQQQQQSRPAVVKEARHAQTSVGWLLAAMCEGCSVRLHAMQCVLRCFAGGLQEWLMLMVSGMFARVRCCVQVLKAASTLKAGILGVKAPHMVASPRVSTV